jgi:hypothetical protein
MIKQLIERSESNENLIYEFRKESFTGVYEVEKLFIAKNDALRRAIQDLCKHLNIQCNFLLAP